MSELQEKLLEIKNQKDTYILPENLKKNVTAFGVTGTYEGSGGSGDVKLFETVEEMQADPSAQEGDLAVVYREEIQPVTEDSEFSSCIFPNEVVLDETFTSEIYGSFRAVDSSSSYFDGMVSMSSSSFNFSGWGESSQVRVQYTSQDGITYTRTDGGDELIDFGITIKWEPHEEFNNVIGNFMKVSGNYFDGMYEYAINLVDATKLYWCDVSDCTVTWSETRNEVTSFVVNAKTNNYIDGNTLKQLIPDIQMLYSSATINNVTFFLNTSDELCFVITSYGNSAYNLAYNKTSGNSPVGIGLGVGASMSQATLYKVDSSLTSFTKVRDIAPTQSGSWTYTPLTDIKTIPITINLTGKATSSNLVFTSANFDTTITNSIDCKSYYNYYLPINSQLTLSNPNELLPGKIAYGKNSVVEGDRSIYNNLDKEELLKTVLNLPLQYKDDDIAIYDYNDKTKYISNYDEYPAGKFKLVNNLSPDISYYRLGILEDYKDVTDLYNLTGEKYTNFYCSKSYNSKNYMILAKKVSDSYFYALVINPDFTQILFEQKLDYSISNPNNVYTSDIGISFQINQNSSGTGSCIYYILDGENNKLQVLGDPTTNQAYNLFHSKSGYIFTILSRGSSSARSLYAYNVNTGTLTSVENIAITNASFTYTYVFDNTDHTYFIILDGSAKNEKIYKFDKANSTIALYKSSITFSQYDYSPLTNKFHYILGNCYETSDVIIDYSTNTYGILNSRTNTYPIGNGKITFDNYTNDYGYATYMKDNYSVLNVNGSVVKNIIVQLPDTIEITNITYTNYRCKYNINYISIIDYIPEIGKILDKVNCDENNIFYNDFTNSSTHNYIGVDKLISSGYMFYAEYDCKYLLKDDNNYDLLLLRTDFGDLGSSRAYTIPICVNIDNCLN